MGSCEDPNSVDEALGGLSPDLACLLPVRKAGGHTDNCSGDVNSGLVDEGRGLNLNSGIEQISCFQMACELLNCDGDMTSRPDFGLLSCSEVTCDFSNCNGDAKNSLDGFHASYQACDLSNCNGDTKNFSDSIHASSQACDLLSSCNNLSKNRRVDLMNSGINMEKSRSDHADLDLWVSEQMSQNACGVSKVESEIDNQLCFLGPDISILEGEGCHGQDGSGKLVRDVESHSASSPITASVSGCIELYEPKDSENLVGHSEDSLTDPKVVDDKCGDLAGILVNLNGQPSIEEKVACNLLEAPPNFDSDCAVKDSTALQSCQSVGIVDSGFSKSSVVYRSERQDNEGNDIRCHHVSVTEFHDVISPCPRRSSRASKSNQMNTNLSAGKPKKVANKMSVPCRVPEISFKIARGRRSCSLKPARSYIWGTLANTVQLFERNNGILKHDSQLVHSQNLESRKARSGRGNPRRKKTLAGESSRGSKGKHRESTNRIRLKIRVGKGEAKTMLSDTLASEETIGSEFPPELNCRIGVEIPKLASAVKHEFGVDVLDAKLDAYLGDKELESIVTEDSSVSNTAGDCHGVYSHIGTDALLETIDNKYSEPGTSPDSEVINLIQDALVSGACAGVPDGLQDAVVTSSQVVDPTYVMDLNMKSMRSKKGKKKDKFKGGSHAQEGHGNVKEQSHRAKLNKAGKSAKSKPVRRVHDRYVHGDTFISVNSRKESSNSSGMEEFQREPELLSGKTEHIRCGEPLKSENGPDTSTYYELHDGIISLESWASEGTLPSAKNKRHKFPRNSKSNGGESKSRSTIPDSARHRRGNRYDQKKGKLQKSVSKREVKERDVLDQAVNMGENYLERGRSINFPAQTIEDSAFTRPSELSKIQENNLFDDLVIIDAGNKVASHNSAMVSNGLLEQYLPPRKAWVRCDDCHKWRCISAALADSIEETNCRWTCNDNMDKSFADCSIPQEKSNAEINAELEISDASCEEDAYDARSNSKGFERRSLTVHQQQASWKLIKSNMFLHRSRKTQIIDEIMVCHCKASVGGSLGCRDECLNRMLNIECVKGTCPCGDLCSNQKFQKRKYSKLKWFRCGKKGYGLQLLEDVSQGEFLIEYVGEVLDFHAYEARQREYASRAQKHFYFMTLNGSEVIDACAKGNLGRFINHSCDPNCCTEKWMVNGEVCIGLFAIRDIKKGEEVTFDYNYVRVFGAAAKKCVCGSSQCRGYIGGDPLNTDAIVQGESDEEYPEPVMVLEDAESWNSKGEILAITGFDKEAKVAEILLQTEDTMDKSVSAIGQLVSFVENENVGRSVSSVSSSEMKSEQMPLQSEDTMTDKSAPAIEHLEISVENKEKVRKSVSSVSSLATSLKAVDKMRTLPSAIEEVKNSLQAEDIFGKALSSVKMLETTSVTTDTMNTFFYDSAEVNRGPKSDAVEVKLNISKARPLMNSSRLSSSVKRGKSNVHPKISNTPLVVTNKPKKLLEGAANGRLEGVEEKLNELLDANGGISKRKDATKGYLKLLLVTAASRDNCNHMAIQSTRRDLSMILDALLKTKSRGVLVDIINKNGLQMLHNIMKQSRRGHHQIPILRKLLKVLEFLAMKEILTFEHINGGPPCPGMESFRESIFTLTRHSDSQVHQIARNFRDRWIPRNIRRFNVSDRDDGKLELRSRSNCNSFSSSYKHWHDQGVRPTETIDCISQAMIASTPLDANTFEGSSALSAGSCPTIGTKTRKRKSRWDQPAETNTGLQPEHIKEQKVEPSLKQELEHVLQQSEIGEVVPDPVMEVDKEEANCNGCVSNCRQDEAAPADDARQRVHVDAPPGFSSPIKSTPFPAPLENVGLSSFTCDVVTGHPQGRYLSHLPVSYGIPLSLVQQFGTPEAESFNIWTIAPGVPFHPFPPLPPFPHEDSNPQPRGSKPMMTSRPEGVRQACRSSASYHTDPSTPSTSGARPLDVEAKEVNNQQFLERGRCSSYGLGRKFRQRRWNHNRKHWFPCIRRRSPGFKGNNLRHGVYSVGVGNVPNEIKGVSSRCLNGSSTQHPQHPYQNDL